MNTKRKFIAILLVCIMLTVSFIGSVSSAEPDIYSFSANSAEQFSVTHDGNISVYTNVTGSMASNVVFEVAEDIPFQLFAYEYDGTVVGGQTGILNSQLETGGAFGSETNVQRITTDVANNILVAVKFGEGSAEPGIYSFSANSAEQFSVTHDGNISVYTNVTGSMASNVVFEVAEDIPFQLFAYEYDGTVVGGQTGILNSQLETGGAFGSETNVQRITTDVANNILVAVKFGEGSAEPGETDTSECLFSAGERVYAFAPVNIRQSASVSSADIGSINTGESIVIINIENNWLQHSSGWSHCDFFANSPAEAGGSGTTSSISAQFITQYFSSSTATGLTIIRTESGQGRALDGRFFGGSDAVVIFGTTPGLNLLTDEQGTAHGNHDFFAPWAICHHNHVQTVTIGLEVNGEILYTAAMPTPIDNGWCQN